MNKLDKIKPLEWEKRLRKYYTFDNEYLDTILFVKTILGFIEIYYNNTDAGDSWMWSYRTCDEQATTIFLCESLEDGKQKAEEFYLKKLKEALIEL